MRRLPPEGMSADVVCAWFHLGERAELQYRRDSFGRRRRSRRRRGGHGRPAAGAGRDIGVIPGGILAVVPERLRRRSGRQGLHDHGLAFDHHGGGPRPATVDRVRRVPRVVPVCPVRPVAQVNRKPYSHAPEHPRLRQPGCSQQSGGEREPSCCGAQMPLHRRPLDPRWLEWRARTEFQFRGRQGNAAILRAADIARVKPSQNFVAARVRSALGQQLGAGTR